MGTRAVILERGKFAYATHWDGDPDSLGQDLIKGLAKKALWQVADLHSIDSKSESEYGDFAEYEYDVRGNEVYVRELKYDYDAPNPGYRHHMTRGEEKLLGTVNANAPGGYLRGKIEWGQFGRGYMANKASNHEDAKKQMENTIYQGGDAYIKKIDGDWYVFQTALSRGLNRSYPKKSVPLIKKVGGWQKENLPKLEKQLRSNKGQGGWFRQRKAHAIAVRKGIQARLVGKSNSMQDRMRRAKKPGKRRSANGNVYYENRRNRADKGKYL